MLDANAQKAIPETIISNVCLFFVIKIASMIPILADVSLFVQLLIPGMELSVTVLKATSQIHMAFVFKTANLATE